MNGLERDSTSGGTGSVAAIDGSAAVNTRKRSRTLLSAFFIGAGVNHFLMPGFYRKIVPPSMGDPATLVTVSGVAEIAGGVGVLLPPTRRAAGVGLIALLAAVFPANIHMARNPHKFSQPRWALYARLPLQPLAMLWAWRATR